MYIIYVWILAVLALINFTSAVEDRASQDVVTNPLFACLWLGPPYSGDGYDQLTTASAADCRSTCLNRWKTSRHRGMYGTNDNGGSEQNPCSSSQGATCSKLYYPPGKTLDPPPNLSGYITKWKLSPCYSISGKYANVVNQQYGPGPAMYGFESTHPFSGSAQDVNFLSGQSTDSSIKYVKEVTVSLRSDTPSLCKEGGIPSAYSDLCLAWKFNTQNHRCSLYKNALTTATSIPYTVSGNDVYSISQNLYCSKDAGDIRVAKWATDLQGAQGCALEGSSFTGSVFQSKADNPHECRRSCQQHLVCYVWKFDSLSGSCYGGTVQSLISYGDDGDYTTGTAYCPTCLEGYYIPVEHDDMSDGCIPCPQGYKCKNGRLQRCSGGLFCGDLGIVTPSEYDNSNDATSCLPHRSGVGCQHMICEASRLGQALAQMNFQDPFGFFRDHEYSIDELDVRETLVNIDKNGLGKHGLEIRISHSLSPELFTHFAGEIHFPSNKYSVSIINPAWDCADVHTTIVQSTTSIPSTMSIGDTFSLQNWQMHWNKSAVFDPANWFSTDSNSKTLVNDLITILPTQPSYALSFLSQVKISVGMLGSQSRRPGVTIYYQIGNRDPTIYTAATGSDGTVTVTVKDSTTKALTSSITILAANKTNADYNIRLCPEGLESCRTTSLGLPHTKVLSYLQAYTVELIDVNVIPIQGVLTTLFESGSCAAADVEVHAMDVSNDVPVIIDSAVTASDGSFSLAASATYVQLLFGEVKDTLDVPSNEDAVVGALLSSAGLLLTSELPGLDITYTRTSTLDIHAAATVCDYSIGAVDIFLTIDACPGIVLHRTFVETYSFWNIPSAKYTFEMNFASGNKDIKDSYELLYPDVASRSINLISKNATLNFLYQPEPRLFAEISTADSIPRGQCDLGTLPFDSVTSGSSDINIEVSFLQTYTENSGVSHTCAMLPHGASVVVSSQLAPGEDNTCESKSPCVFPVNVVSGIDKSVADTTVYVGQPSNPGGKLTETVNIEYEDLANFVRTISFSLQHPVFWPSADLESLPSVELRFLVVGVYTLSDATSINFASAVPLYYLYSPPQLRAGNGDIASQASATFTRPFSVESRLFHESVDSVEVSSTTALGVSGSGNSWSASLDTSSSQSSISANTTNREDYVVTTTTTYTFSQTTAGEDLVIYMGWTANLSRTKTLTYHSSSCRISATPNIGWQSKTSSLIVSTRAECEASYQTVKDTIALYENSKDMQSLVTDAKEQRNKWLDLFLHWDTDRLTAQNYPVDLTASIQGGAATVDKSHSNRLTLRGALGEFTFQKTAINTTMRLTDYLALSTSDAVSDSTSAELSLFLISMSRETSETYTQTFTLDETTYETSGYENTITTTLVSSEGTFLTMEVYESPFCGSFVYKVIDGETYCPHVPGTSLLGAFSLLVDESNTVPDILNSDKGSISFYIDLSRSVLPSSVDGLNLIISMDAHSTTGYISYTIGKDNVNQGFAIKISSDEINQSLSNRHLVVINYERTSASLMSTVATVTVSSECDSSISDSVSFSLNWESSCRKPMWGGALSAAGATWEITAIIPNITVEYTASSTSSNEVSLWAAHYNAGSGLPTEEEYFKVADFENTEINFIPALSAFNAEGQYVLELRTGCGARSDPRLGVYDNKAPRLVGWAPRSNVIKPMASQSVATFRFHEPFNCSFSGLEVTVKRFRDEAIAPTNFTCSSSLHDLELIIHLNSSSAVDAWSGETASVTMSGVRDLFDNELESFDILISLPDLPLRTSESDATLPSWTIATPNEISQYVSNVRASILPANKILSSPTMGSKPDSSKRVAIIASVVTVFVTLVLGAIAFVLYKKRRLRTTSDFHPQARKESLAVSPVDGRKHVDSLNPSFSSPSDDIEGNASKF